MRWLGCLALLPLLGSCQHLLPVGFLLCNACAHAIAEQFGPIKQGLPLQRGNVSIDNLQVLNAILHVACAARALWQLAHPLHTQGALGPRWRAGLCLWLDVMFAAFITVGPIAEALRQC